MKMRIATICATVLLFFSMLIPSVHADGCIYIYDKDMWGLFDEEQQLCAINHKRGTQNMILTIDTSEELRGERAVWIFPVPATPEKTGINILKGFPELWGYDVEAKAEKSISDAFSTMRLTQIYPLLFATLGARLGVDIAGRVTVHERIEKMGLTTELISATDADSLSDYLNEKNLNLGPDSRAIFDEYLRQEFSFVVSWISDIETFKQAQENGDESRRGMGNRLGVFISFPTEKMYYPLKPTSVYESKKIPAVIYVMDFVEPNLYDAIKERSRVTYFVQDVYQPQEGLEDFFFGRKFIGEVEYTKIRIDAPAKNLTQDLWMEKTTPSRVHIAKFVAKYFRFGPALVLFAVCSGLASLGAGLIIFRKDSPSVSRCMLMGLCNFFTIIGFSMTAYAVNVEKKCARSQTTQQRKASLRKVIAITLLIALIIFLFPLFLLVGSFAYLTIQDIVGIVIAYAFIGLFISPFVWGWYNNRRIMKYTILFSIFFVVVTRIVQALTMAVYYSLIS